MVNQADVRSLEQIEKLHEQLVALRTRLMKELEVLQSELRRLTNWLEEHVANYWSKELIQARRRLREFEDNLSRCQSYVRSNEQRPCTEEKKRVRLAAERVELCERKIKYLKQACRQWESEQLKIRSRLKRCYDMSESDLFVAANHLANQIDRLREYAGLRSPVSRDNAHSSTGTPAEPPTQSERNEDGSH